MKTTWKPKLETLEDRMVPSGFGPDDYRDAPLPENKYGPVIRAGDGTENINFSEDIVVLYQNESGTYMWCPGCDSYRIPDELFPKAETPPDDPPAETPPVETPPPTTPAPESDGGGIFSKLFRRKNK